MRAIYTTRKATYVVGVMAAGWLVGGGFQKNLGMKNLEAIFMSILTISTVVLND